MKIRPVTPELRDKVYALLHKAFPGSAYEAELVRQLHAHGRPLQEWVCLQTGRVIAYLAFSRAYRDGAVCGLHLAPMAVAPECQGQGVGSELLRFALRQEGVREQTLFVLGEPAYYRRFGFEPCRIPICQYDKDNAHFLSLRNAATSQYIVNYEPEFKTAEKAAKTHRPVAPAARQRRRPPGRPRRPGQGKGRTPR